MHLKHFYVLSFFILGLSINNIPIEGEIGLSVMRKKHTREGRVPSYVGVHICSKLPSSNFLNSGFLNSVSQY